MDIKHTGLILLSAAIGAATLSAQAEQRVLEEVTVTAQKRTQNLQDVPISVSAVSGLKMAEAGINNLEDMTAYVPNLTMNQTGIGTIIAIRGISSGINQGFEQSVGQYVDGVYYGRAQLARAPFMDLERVEVLRGPQSILFGKNSIAGAISMITAKPTDEFEGSFTALYEPDHEETDVKLVLSGPLTDTLKGRLAILDRTIDGYFKNTTLDNDESDEDVEVIRGSLLWEPNSDWKVTLKVEDGSFDTKGRFIDIIEPAEVSGGGTPYAAVLSALTGGAYTLDTEQNFKRQSNGDTSENDTENLTLTVEYGLGEHTLTLVSGYNGYEYEERCDCDFVGAPIFLADTEEDFDQFSQEIRITSPGGETIDYIGGFFYQTSDLEFNDSISVPTDSILGTAVSAGLLGTATNRHFQQDSDLWSVFAQATWNITEEARLTLGGRFTSEDKDAERRQYHLNSSGVEQPIGTPADPLNVLFGLFKIEPYDTIKEDRNESAFTPLITFQYDVNVDTMLYATYTTGFKSGGFDVRSNAHPSASVVNALQAGVIDLQGVFEYEEEEAESFEIGGKFTFADGTAELNAAVFITEYTDLQISQFDGTLGFNVTNAGEATSQGIELDGRWAATEGLTLSGSLAYLDFEYDKFPNAQCYFDQTDNIAPFGDDLCDAKGETREFTPEYQGSLSADYSMAIGNSLEFRATLDLIYSDNYLTSATLDPRTEQDSYTKVNARISIGSADDKWDIALVGKNLTDEEVITFSNTAPVSTTLTGGTGTVYYSFYDRPSSVALQASLRF